MDISKFKNIILCVLLAANLVLAAVLGVRAYENYRLDRTAAEDTVSALRSLGTNVELEQLDTDTPPLYPSEVERDLEAERELARSFIGEHTIAEGGSGIYRLEGDRGSAGLQNAGRMTITFSDELSANFSDAEEMFRAVGVDSEYYAAQLGIYSDELVVSDTGMSRRISGAEVFGLSLDARVVDGGVAGLDGGILLGEVYVTEDSRSKSLAAALLALSSQLSDAGTPAGNILSSELGWTAELAAPGYTHLEPTWRVVTENAGTWLVDAMTLSVSRA